MILNKPIYENYNKYLERDLLQLFNSAIYALKEEDACLSKAFAQVPHEFNEFYGECNRGLAYSVFETALVYLIFKAWVPLAPVSWEECYENTNNKKADLVVYDKKTNLVKYLFEAKWWMSNRKYELSSLKNDSYKMMEWEGSHDRFLMTFWYSDLLFFENDRSDISKFTSKPISDKKNGKIRLEEVFFGAFPTEVRNKNWSETKEGYFGMSIIQVESH